MMQIDHHEAQERLERVSHGHMATNRSEGEFTNALEISQLLDFIWYRRPDLNRHAIADEGF